MSRRTVAMGFVILIGLGAGLTLAALTPPDVRFEYLEVADVDRHDLDASYDLVALSTFTAMAY